MKRRSLLIGLVILILIGFASVPRVASWWSRRGIIAEQQSVQLPPVQHFNVSASVSSSSSFFSSIPSISSISSPASLSSAVNWDVPFTSQAPAGNWDPPYNEACEEASVFMTLSYFHSQSIASPDDADRGIVAMVAANAALGFPIDDTAAQVQSLLKSQDPSLDVSLLSNPTVKELQDNLRDGALIILPLAGRDIGNPYYRNPGPLYHMLVLRGFTADGHVITNDPGTKRGEEFVYRFETLLNANHDWNGGDVENGQKVAIVVRKK